MTVTMKCRYLDEKTGGKGVIFATGTPISNSMTEMFTLQRYLQYDKLQEMGLGNFDAWASTFGETITVPELAPEGGYRARTRFAKFQNLPELMKMFGEVADIKTADTLNLNRPDAIFETIVAQPTQTQQDLVESLSKRATAIQENGLNPFRYFTFLLEKLPSMTTSDNFEDLLPWSDSVKIACAVGHHDSAG